MSASNQVIANANKAIYQTTVANTSQPNTPSQPLPDSRKAIPFESNSVEDEYRQLKKIAETKDSITPAMVNNPKKATTSYINDYGFISYGGSYLNGDSQETIKNKFYGLDNTSFPSDGLLADFEEWKVPTTENIINWSRNLFSSAKAKNPSINTNGVKVVTTNQYTNTGIGSTEEAGLASTEALKTVGDINNQVAYTDSPTIGNLRYDWKDFSFCKHYGKIPNNRLITLRRFKLPVLDSGSIISKEKLIEAFGRDEEYLTSDSARALTYYGDDTGNNLNDIISMDVGLNWEQLETNMRVPEINRGLDNLGGGSNNLYDAYDWKGDTLGDILGVKGTNGADSWQAKILNIIAMNAQSTKTNQADQTIANNQTKNGLYTGEDVQNVRDLALQTKDADIWQHGWVNRVYGPINVITKTHVRSRGLKFNNNPIRITFKYDLMQVDTINPKLAMIDIISNILALTYANGSFYGGDYRFQRQPTEMPLPEDFVNLMQKLASGQGDNMTAKEFTDKFKGTLENVTRTAVGITSTFKDEYEKLAKASPEIYKIIQDTIARSKTSANATTQADFTNSPQPFKDLSAILGNDSTFMNSLAQLGNLSTIFGNGTSEMAGKIDEIFGSGRSITKSAFSAFAFSSGYSISNTLKNLFSLAPLITGEPVGEWHLTVGNPMNPTAMIGNLICTDCSISFGEKLGADDFPTELIAVITLKHGRDRDKGDIESIYNQGQGRFYVKVSPTNSDEPWNTGASSKNTENDTANPVESQLTREANIKNERNFNRTMQEGGDKILEKEKVEKEAFEKKEVFRKKSNSINGIYGITEDTPFLG